MTVASVSVMAAAPMPMAAGGMVDMEATG